MINGRLILLVVLAAVVALPAWSQTNTDWQNLSDEQRRTLQRFEGDWEQIPNERRERLVRGAQRWQQMSPDQRQQAQQHHHKS